MRGRSTLLGATLALTCWVLPSVGFAQPSRQPPTSGQDGPRGALTLTAPTGWIAPSFATADGSVAGTMPLRLRQPDPIPPTFAYTEPQEKHYLRAVLGVQSVFVLGFLWYLTAPDLNRGWSVDYDWTVFRRKVMGQAFGPDVNHFGTNFIGHPLGGTGYYLAARSSRLSIAESFLLSVGGSLIWELFGEVREIISMNDMLVTPLGGLAIGEAVTQFSAFLDRSAPTTSNRVLSSVINPFKSLGDWADGATPRRTGPGYPRDEWHRFDLMGGVGVVEETEQTSAPGGQQFVEGRLRVAERIFRLPGFADPGQDSRWFYDGNASGIEAETAFTGDGLTDLFVATQAVLVGHYQRQSEPMPYGWWGGGYIGWGATFEYALHDYQRGKPSAIDHISTVQPLSLVMEHYLHQGGLTLHSLVDIGPAYGGIRSFAIDDFERQPANLPPVTQQYDYYLGLGGRGRARLGLDWQALSLALELRAEAYRGVGGPGEEVKVRLFDTMSLFRGWVGYQIPRSPFGLFAMLERRARTGSLEQRSADAKEHSFVLAVNAVY
jgi:hypothetical protein